MNWRVLKSLSSGIVMVCAWRNFSMVCGNVYTAGVDFSDTLYGITVNKSKQRFNGENNGVFQLKGCCKGVVYYQFSFQSAFGQPK